MVKPFIIATLIASVVSGCNSVKFEKLYPDAGEVEDFSSAHDGGDVHGAHECGTFFLHLSQYNRSKGFPAEKEDEASRAFQYLLTKMDYRYGWEDLRDTRQKPTSAETLELFSAAANPETGEVVAPTIMHDCKRLAQRYPETQNLGVFQ